MEVVATNGVGLSAETGIAPGMNNSLNIGPKATITSVTPAMSAKIVKTIIFRGFFSVGAAVDVAVVDTGVAVDAA
jgi:hypothetical protein